MPLLLRYLVLLLLAVAPIFAQGGGRSFVLSFGENPGVEQSDGWLRVYVTAGRATSGSVSYGATRTPFSVAPGAVTAIALPATLATAAGVERKGIIVEADDSLTVIGATHADGSSDAFLVYPVEALDTAYLVPGWPAYERQGDSYFTVVGVDDATVLTIRPPRAGAPVVVVVDRGETYTMRGNDLTGWSIRASRPVAMSAGAISARVPSAAAGSSRGYSHLTEQILPVSRWDSSALALPHPTPERAQNNRYRITAAFDSTIVRINGLLRLRLDRGGSFEEDLDGSKKITATNPFLVSQYEMSPLFGDGDPFMVLIAPTAQLLSDYRFIALPTPEFDRHYVVISAPREEIGSLRIDDLPLPDTLRWVFNGISGFSFATMALEPGAHRMHSASGASFSLTVCGYGDGESYGYVGGMKHERILERFDRRAPLLVSLRTESCSMREILLRDTGEIVSGFGPDAVEELHLLRAELGSLVFSSDSTRLVLRLRITDPSDSGFANITLVDRSGNRRRIHVPFPRSSFTLAQLLTDGERVISVEQGSVRCSGFEITNGRDEPIVLVSGRLSGNRAFSIPPNSFPLLIPARTTIPLLLCADGGIERGESDTLLLSDSCGTVAAYALRLDRTLVHAVDNCGSDLVVSSVGRAKGNPEVLTIAPHPVGADGASIHLDTGGDAVRLQLLSTRGEIVLDRLLPAGTRLQSVRLESETLPSGEYIVRLLSNGVSVAQPIRLVVVR